jgi:hypothetical protein
LHRFLYFDGKPAENTPSRVEREVPIERTDLLRAEVLLRALPGLQRTDTGQKSLAESVMTFSGNSCYQTTGICLKTNIKVGNNRKAWITVGYGGDFEIEATACCNELARLFKGNITTF